MQTTHNKEIITANPRTEMVDRVNAIKSALPKNYKQIILLHYPQYDSLKGAHRINNVITGKAADRILTEILESIANGELKLKAA